MKPDHRVDVPAPVATSRLERRGFLGAVAGAAAAGAPLSAARESVVEPRQRSTLVHEDGAPLRASELEVGACYVFNYPYVSTPCFVINLGGAPALPEPLLTEDGAAYMWQGGSGASGAIVAYCAICSHKLSHPAKSISFINYRHEPVRFRSASRKDVVGENLIYCCSDKSVFDPRKGARVLGGPAKQPLASILLEHDPVSDSLTAIGTFGGHKFDAFFDKFGHRIALERGLSDVRATIGSTTLTVPIEQFSVRQMRCGAA